MREVTQTIGPSDPSEPFSSWYLLKIFWGVGNDRENDSIRAAFDRFRPLDQYRVRMYEHYKWGGGVV